MIVGVLLNHVLDALCVVYVIKVTWQIARGYGLLRTLF